MNTFLLVYAKSIPFAHIYKPLSTHSKENEYYSALVLDAALT